MYPGKFINQTQLNNPILAYRTYVLFFVLTAITFNLSAQRTDKQSDYLQWFDQQIGIENTTLYKGIIYRETYRTINDKVKFYKSPQWFDGSVVYSGQLFSNIQLKYDVFGDQLIVKQLDRLGGGGLLLFKDKVSEFVIDNTVFVNVKDIPKSSEFAGFYELLLDLDNDTRLLAKHFKNDFVRKDRRATYYEFIDLENEYVLEHGRSYYRVNSKKELLKVYPEAKKAIDSFYQKNKRLRSRDMDAFMVALINSLEEDSSTTSGEIN